MLLSVRRVPSAPCENRQIKVWRHKEKKRLAWEAMALSSSHMLEFGSAQRLALDEGFTLLGQVGLVLAI
jgi:hypothetical protein